MRPHKIDSTLYNEKLNCLLFADDALILSESPEGLNALCHFQAYCNKWFLEVNISQTKVMICNKQGIIILVTQMR